ncbi:MAG TPA: histidine phosphatase family protein [Gaiellaceae bacterium]|nr:histidine phosphatase family protein [Gaiellaceae bacterium]
MTTILLARHGETDWNVERRVQGHTDRPLNETGRAQARSLADELAGDEIDVVYSSDLIRAHETARIVADRRGLGVTAIPELRERDFGTWEGLTDDDILARFPDAHHRPWGDAETKEEMAQRVMEALRRISAAHGGARVLVVTHGGPLRAVLTHCGVEGIGKILNCQVARVEVVDGHLRAVD